VTPKGKSTGAAVLSAARELPPAYFALVMATGVMSIACQLLGLRPVASVLLGTDWIAFVVLWVLTAIRLVLYPAEVREDLFDHQRGPGFLTLVAGTCVIGAESAVVGGAQAIATWLWYVGLGLWLVLNYAFFTAVIVRADKPGLGDGINGLWLTTTVAAQSIVALRGVLDISEPPALEVQFLSFALFLAGGVLYLALVPLIVYRLAFLRFVPGDFSPPYWINMGAAAITTLAGSTLMARTADWLLIGDFLPFLRGVTLAFWAAATWWIPLLLALFIWRYVVRKDKLVYEPGFWGMVFPLAMYTAATYELSQALDLPFLGSIAQIFLFVALAAWLGTFAGLLIRLGRAAAGVYTKAGQ
jgi:tellurite resistance protein TehA-like permease